MKRIPGAFISARYSTDNQNPDSIEVQVSRCTQWCNQHSIPILGIFADEATSGMKDSRPQYEAMLCQLRQGIADTVVIYDQSRMFRKMTAWFAFRDEMTALGVRIVSVTQPMVGRDLRDPTNFLTEGSMALFNQIWALQSRQKTMEKMRFMARNGQHTGGKPALGYQVVDGRLEIHPEEAAIVRRIFSEYASGRSYREIIAGLNADGLKTKRGASFGSNSLHDLLKNEKYTGTLLYGKNPYREDGTRNSHAPEHPDMIRVENAVPAIIDKELFLAVRERMKQNRHQQGGRPPTKRDYPLRGKVFCGSCKAAMTISTSQRVYDYYKCSGRKRLHQCDATPIRVDDLERIVSGALRAVLGHPEDVNGLIRILRDQAEQLQGGAVDRLRAMIARDQELTRQIDNAVSALLGGLQSQAVKDKLSAMESEQTALHRDMRLLKAQVDASAIPERRLRQILEDILSQDADPSILLSIVYRVEVSPETITIWTILDADPTGTIDHTSTNGVTITEGSPSGVPIVFVTADFLRICVARNNPSW